MRKQIMAIMMDASLSDAEKARKRQDLLMGTWSKPAAAEDAKAGAKEDKKAKPPAKGACASTAAHVGGTNARLILSAWADLAVCRQRRGSRSRGLRRRWRQRFAG